MGNPWVKSSALIMPQILQSRLSERTANCSLTLENKNQTHLRVQWVVFLAFLLSQSDLESSVSSTLSSPPRIDSPSGRIFFVSLSAFKKEKAREKAFLQKRSPWIQKPTEAIDVIDGQQVSLQCLGTFWPFWAFCGRISDHFGIFFWSLLTLHCLKLFFVFAEYESTQYTRTKLNRSPEYSIGLGSGPKNKYIKVWSCLRVSRRIWRSIALMNLSLYLSVCLSIHPPIHPSISLPPSLALSLSLLSLSLDASFDVKSTLDLFAGGNSDVSDIYAWLDCVCFSLSLWGIIKCVCHAPASFGWMWTSLVSFERFSKSMAHTLCYFSAAML